MTRVSLTCLGMGLLLFSGCHSAPKPAPAPADSGNSITTSVPTGKPVEAGGVKPVAATPAKPSGESVPKAQPTPTQAAAGVPLLPGLGAHTRQIATTSPEAQKYFDQGLTLAFAFNHDEAIAAFEQAAKLDPQCAMAWWGIALCNGPHINNPSMDEAHSKAAWDAILKAQASAYRTSPAERGLIEALAARYRWPAPTDRSGLDREYARAMKRTYIQFKEDADVATIYAESLMDLRPWDLWSSTGEPREETPLVIEALERALSINPNHPGANHLYIHTMEASPTPDKALASADLLCTLVPGAGHLVHMPAHIYARTGRWAQASRQNELAMESDRRYRELRPRQGFYNVYMAHNPQFLSFACMMQGRSKDAIAAARKAVGGIPAEFASEAAPLVDGFFPLAYEALIRFGKWKEILAEPQPDAKFPVTVAMWRFARATALAALDRVSDAKAEQTLFREAAKAVPPDAMVINNTAKDVLAIADHVLEGEIAYREGRIEDSVNSLKKGVDIEDTLKYDEPPDWLIPVRHTLGAVLVDASRFEEAERVYREDLRKWPENGWSLFGLGQCLAARGGDEFGDVQARFRKAWSDADITLGATCLCVPSKAK